MESFAADLATMVRTPLGDDHVAAMRARGSEHDFAKGDVIVAPGAPMGEFHYLLDGEIEAFDPTTDQRYGGAVLGRGQFTGDLGFLTGANAILGNRAISSGRLLSVPRGDMLRLMSDMPEMSDIVVTVFAARRRRMVETERAGIALIGVEDSRELRALAAFAGRNRLPCREIALNTEEARELAQACGAEPGKPMAMLGRGQLIEPATPKRLAQLLGIDLALPKDEVLDVLIVGAGPAGVAAAVYAGAEGLSALVLEDTAIGGQAGTSSRIENYMGFPTGISGADLVGRGEIQAMKFGTRFAMPRGAVSLAQCSKRLFHVTLDDNRQVSARALVIATGVQYRRLPWDRLDEFEGAGVYYAATKSEARFCQGREVVVIGGGNSAGQAAMFLSRTASHVHVLIRGDSLASSMSDYLSSRLEATSNITLHRRTEVTRLHGGDTLEAITVDADGTEQRMDVCGMFVMVGAAPNTDWLSDLVSLDEKGFVRTGEAAGQDFPYATSCPGVFAVGDVRAGSVKRVASAVGEGSVVIGRVWDHVNTGG
ncbi:thioredoxin reductase (NADPH) [Roseovarius nanhaiticus]|uniref:Thioredoxin reductase n=1 Tax=Roseovarius nanhaiticus TaxID=573024 RepID=A0A1N7GZ87_9RHOB|nr:cyclic nucleotide-binding domain-containing thioredoxin-disulfide reductase [Roseovarius nanhaiticus]SEL19124.1 thioredoxin reductase (NADPH) [Roseovarius nanhaiticus]SIS17836.1 thioredoxin reductase (NADPH) [Roseovarius nanhaiticus]